MKNLVEYIKESLGNAYNDNSSLAVEISNDENTITKLVPLK